MDESCQKMDCIKRDSIQYRTVFTHTVVIFKRTVESCQNWTGSKRDSRQYRTVFTHTVHMYFTRFRKAFAIAYWNTGHTIGCNGHHRLFVTPFGAETDRL